MKINTNYVIYKNDAGQYEKTFDNKTEKVDSKH